MQQFRYESLPGRIVFGAGTAHTALTGELDRLDAARIMLVATESGEALARRLAEPFADRVVAVFTATRPHVPVSVAEAARALATSVRADVLVSVGGGSTTGTAKVIALTSGLPIVAVPTTYAGSEVTPVWGLTDASRKSTGRDSRVLPRAVVYDPELTLTLPTEISAASGLNAMAHCVEAFWAPGRNPVSALAAEEGIRALSAGLPVVVADPADIAARSDLLYGAYLAGSAFAAAGSGLHHRICHVLGGAYNLPHALTHAIVLPYVLAFNAPAVPDAAHRIGRALGRVDLEGIEGSDDSDNSDHPVLALEALTARVGIPRGLRQLGLREDQVDEAAERVQASSPADNPRPVDLAALREIIHGAWAGLPLAAAAPNREHR